MSRIILLVEGETEQAVVREVIAPHVAGRGVFLTAALVGRPGRKRGGIRPFQQVRRDIERLLRQEPGTRIGTLFDYYGLPQGWPGLAEARRKTGLQKSIAVETAMAEDIASAMGSGFRRERFIPYIQLHELEALLFVEPRCMAEAFEDPSLAASFADIVAEFGNDCEMIDDGLQTAPSKRIQSVYPKYQKGKGLNSHTPLILIAIGIERLRNACRHFGNWCHLLETAI